MASIKWILIWIISMVLVGLATFIYTDQIRKQECARHLLAQSQQYQRIVEDINSIGQAMANLEKKVSQLHEIRIDLLDAHVTSLMIAGDQHHEVYSQLDQMVREIRSRGAVKKVDSLQSNLTDDYEAYCQSVETAIEFNTYLYHSLKQVVDGLNRRIRTLRRQAIANLKKYRKMMKEIREFLKLPVKVDFDPQEDIKYVNKRIREAELEIANLNQLQSRLDKLHNKIGKN